MNATESASNIPSAFLFHNWNLILSPFSKLKECPPSFHNRNARVKRACFCATTVNKLCCLLLFLPCPFTTSSNTGIWTGHLEEKTDFPQSKQAGTAKKAAINRMHKNLNIKANARSRKDWGEHLWLKCTIISEQCIGQKWFYKESA